MMKRFEKSLGLIEVQKTGDYFTLLNYCRKSSYIYQNMALAVF